MCFLRKRQRKKLRKNYKISRNKEEKTFKLLKKKVNRLKIMFSLKKLPNKKPRKKFRILKTRANKEYKV
jgi:hypothetical protein